MFFYLILVTLASVRLEPQCIWPHLRGLKSISAFRSRVIVLIFLSPFYHLVLFSYTPFDQPISAQVLFCFFSPTGLIALQKCLSEWVVNFVTHVCMYVCVCVSGKVDGVYVGRVRWRGGASSASVTVMGQFFSFCCRCVDPAGD